MKNLIQLLLWRLLIKISTILSDEDEKMDDESFELEKIKFEKLEFFAEDSVGFSTAKVGETNEDLHSEGNSKFDTKFDTKCFFLDICRLRSPKLNNKINSSCQFFN